MSWSRVLIFQTLWLVLSFRFVSMRILHIQSLTFGDFNQNLENVTSSETAFDLAAFHDWVDLFPWEYGKRELAKWLADAHIWWRLRSESWDNVSLPSLQQLTLGLNFARAWTTRACRAARHVWETWVVQAHKTGDCIGMMLVVDKGAVSFSSNGTLHRLRLDADRMWMASRKLVCAAWVVCLLSTCGWPPGRF